MADDAVRPGPCDQFQGIGQRAGRDGVGVGEREAQGAGGGRVLLAS